MTRFDRPLPWTRVAGKASLGLAVVVPLLLVAPSRADAAPVSQCESSRTIELDRRLAAKADEGMRALGRFIERTRTVYQLDMPTALARVERQRAAERACLVSTAST